MLSNTCLMGVAVALTVGQFNLLVKPLQMDNKLQVRYI